MCVWARSLVVHWRISTQRKRTRRKSAIYAQIDGRKHTIAQAAVASTLRFVQRLFTSNPRMSTRASRPCHDVRYISNVLGSPVIMPVGTECAWREFSKAQRVIFIKTKSCCVDV